MLMREPTVNAREWRKQMVLWCGLIVWVGDEKEEEREEEENEKSVSVSVRSRWGRRYDAEPNPRWCIRRKEQTEHDLACDDGRNAPFAWAVAIATLWIRLLSTSFPARSRALRLFSQQAQDYRWAGGGGSGGESNSDAARRGILRYSSYAHDKITDGVRSAVSKWVRYCTVAVQAHPYSRLAT
jgi:hypothetical protein